MNLPPELRNIIYEMVFDSTIIHIAKKTGGPRTRKPAQQAPALLLSCRQTHDEATKIYYSRTTFDFDCVRRLSAWTRKIGSLRRRTVEHVRLPSPRPAVWTLVSPRAMEDIANDTAAQMAAAAAKSKLLPGVLRMDICLPGKEGGFEQIWTSDPVERMRQYLVGATNE